MSVVKDLVEDEVTDQAAAKYNNEIRFDNFIVQALQSNLLTKNNPSCKREQNPSWWDWLQGNQNLETITEEDYLKYVVYLEFFDFLVKKEIIKRKLGFLSFLAVYDYIYNVNNELIETGKLQELLKRDDPDFPKSLLCYNINYYLLSKFLKNYKYNHTDRYEIILANKKNPDTNIVKPPASPNEIKQQGGNNRRFSKLKKKGTKKIKGTKKTRKIRKIRTTCKTHKTL
jgi:hypothetical protein